MEQQRILVIIVSVSLFVAVVIGAALLLTYPRDDEELTRAGRDESESADRFDPIEYLNQPGEDEPSFEPEKRQTEGAGAGDVVIVYGQSEERAQPTETTEEDGAGAAERPQPEQQDTEAGAERVTGIDRTRRQPRSPAAAEQPRRAEGAVAEDRSAAAERDQTQAPPRRTERDRIAEQPEAGAERAEKRGRIGTNYWIQVISSPNLGLVRNAQEALDEKQLGSRITTTNVDDTNYFRLRVGPYSSKSEAQKFLTWVQKIEGFDGSYISETYFRM